MMMREGFVGVHIGAGQHSEARTHLYLSVCAGACKVAVEVLRRGGSALEAACAATMVLENADETNAGFGSNLTEKGTIEMDAGIMDGNSLLFGAVGAVPGIKNPILVAKLLVQEQQKGLLPLGRVPPGFLVGKGARDWAVRHGVEPVPEHSLISEKANKLYKHYKKKLDAFRQQSAVAAAVAVQEAAAVAPQLSSSSSSVEPAHHIHISYHPHNNHNVVAAAANNPSGHPVVGGVAATAAASKRRAVDEIETKGPARVRKHASIGVDGAKDLSYASTPDEPETVEEEEEEDDHVTDTVGVVVMDCWGNVASTVSSGGIALKQPGRVGQAACFGCGCWAQNSRCPGQYSVGISTTGCGEHLVRTFLARECATSLCGSDNPMEALQKVMKEKFAESVFLTGVREKLGGAICMHYDEASGKGEFLWTHTTSSMGIAFQTTADQHATTRMSRLDPVVQQQQQLLLHQQQQHQHQQANSSVTSILVEGIPFRTFSENDRDNSDSSKGSPLSKLVVEPSANKN